MSIRWNWRATELLRHTFKVAWRNSSFNDWQRLGIQFKEKLGHSERDWFLDSILILTMWVDVDRINIEMLWLLNQPVAKIHAVHTGGREAKRANSDVAKGLEAKLLLTKRSRVILTANLWTEAGLVNGAIGTIEDILFGGQGPPSLPVVVFIRFDIYKGATITSLEGKKSYWSYQ